MEPGRPSSAPDWEARYRQIRRTTERLCEPLSPEDATTQSMPEASPAKWHLAHTSWFFETFVLEQTIPDYRPFHPAFRVLFNSYYNSVGEQYSRPERGLLTRPSLEEVLSYRDHVDRRMSLLLADPRVAASVANALEVGLHHEQQHQELILTDVKHLLSCAALPSTTRLHATGFSSTPSRSPRGPSPAASSRLSSRPEATRDPSSGSPTAGSPCSGAGGRRPFTGGAARASGSSSHFPACAACGPRNRSAT
jgi:hypothetical protein